MHVPRTTLSAQSSIPFEPGKPFGSQLISSSSGSFFAELQNQEKFGLAVASMGDMDNDGIRDLIVGAPGRDGGFGAAYLLWINNDGWVHRWMRFAEGENGLSGLQAGDAFGASVAELGDVDGNGFLDLAVGAPESDSSQGAVWILYLDSAGIAASLRLSYADLLVRAGITDPEPMARFGSAVSPFSPESIDGRPGLVVAARGSQRLYFIPFKSNGWPGTPLYMPAPAALESGPWSSFGRSIDAREDGDGDGWPDLLVGAPLADSGRGVAYWLPSGSAYNPAAWQALSLPDSIYAALPTEARLGTAVAWLGDQDWDGQSEWMLGAPGIPANFDGAYVYGSLADSGSVGYAAHFTPSHSRLNDWNMHRQAFGASIANLQDLNSDHYSEAILGISRRDDGGTNRGGILINRLFREGIGTPYDYHYACALGRHMDRHPLPINGTGSGRFVLPDSSFCDTVSVEILYRNPPDTAAPRLQRAGYTDVPLHWFEAVPLPAERVGGADTSQPWAVARIRFPAVDSFRIVGAADATSGWVYLNQQGTGVEVDAEGTKGLFSRYTLRPGQTDRRFLTTVLFPNPRDIFFEVQVNGLAFGKILELTAAVREEWVHTETIVGNGDSSQLIRFSIPGIPGHVHSVSLEMHSPEANGGDVVYAWAAGYPCTINCQPPNQLFFQSTGASTGELFWQRIPAETKTYSYCWFPESDTSAVRCDSQKIAFQVYPTVTIDSLIPGTTYHYRVRNECDGGGLSDWSHYAPFVVPNAVLRSSAPASTGEGYAGTTIPKTRVYPNPVAEHLFLDLPEADLWTWIWVKPDGRTTAPQQQHLESNARLSLPEGTDGLYHLVIRRIGEDQTGEQWSFPVLRMRP